MLRTITRLLFVILDTTYKLVLISMLKIVSIVQMDSRSLAMEMAPVIMWQEGRRPEFYRQYWSQMPKKPSKNNLDPPPGSSTTGDMLSGKSK